MAGVAGRSGGKNIKRPGAKLGNPNHAQGTQPGFTHIEAYGDPEPVIPMPGKWSTAAMQMWTSLLEAPNIRAHEESSGYAYLWLACDMLDVCVKSGYKGVQMAEVLKMFSDLGATEIQRRQAKILIDRTPPKTEIKLLPQEEEAKTMGLY